VQKSGRKEADLLFGSEIVHDVKELPDLFRGLTLDHVSDGLATHVAVDKPGFKTL
jgi:hypothetical protein